MPYNTKEKRIEWQRKYSKQRYKIAMRKGICTRCFKNKLAVGRVQCQKCLDSDNKRTTKYQKRMVEMGFCGSHPKTKLINGQTICLKCVKNGKNYRKRNYDSWLQIFKEYGMNKCSKCGYDKSIYAIDMHHKNPKNKEYNFYKIKQKQVRPEYLKELKKCIALCANCHRELHANKR